MCIFVTGGSGFIGSNFILNWIQKEKSNIINIDKLTYASNNKNLINIQDNPRYFFYKGDIGDVKIIDKILNKFKPKFIVNFAAETHVDRSIKKPNSFIETNINSTFYFLNAVLKYYQNLARSKKLDFRFIHISTDEVFGSLSAADKPFTENSPYQPNNPYSASKACSDHLVRSFYMTYNLPVITTNCSNNYGPYQYPEKFIPLIIRNILNMQSIPIYGDGLQIRDWLYVKDHCDAIIKVLKNGNIGETYNIGGGNNINNLELVHNICDLVQKYKPIKNNNSLDSYKDLIKFVRDRPGHDRKYLINSTKIENQLNWKPMYTFSSGLEETVLWYLNNKDWIKSLESIEYLKWINDNYE